MPDRIIRERATTSESLMLLSGDAERLHWRLTVTCDDYGRFNADPRVVLTRCFPLRAAEGLIKPDQVAVWLCELQAANDTIKLYEVKGKTYGYFPNWYESQRKRDSKPKFPSPPEDNTSFSPRVAASCGELPLGGGRRESRAESREEDSSLRSESLLDLAKKALEAARSTKDQAKRAAIMAKTLETRELAHWYDKDFVPAYPATRRHTQETSARSYVLRSLRPDLGARAAILDHLGAWSRTEDWLKENGRFVPGQKRFFEDRYHERMPEEVQHGGAIGGRITGPQRTTPGAAASGARGAGWESESGYSPPEQKAFAR